MSRSTPTPRTTKGQPPSSRWNEVATLEMVVSYEHPPERSELDAILDLARQAGWIKKATYTVTKPTSEELV